MRKISHYRILDKLGAGGMGEVYLAEDLSLGRKVAIKVLPEQFTQDRSRLERFEREARAVSALNHPNVLTIFEIGEYEGEHFLAVEYIDGETLRERIRRGPMTVGEVIEVASGIAAALAEAHTAGVIHRDIKPENVMIRRDGLVKVLDFGLAKRAESVDPGAPTVVRATAPGTIMGTVTYMSPEQARGLEVDARTDLFSLGAVLYEMLTGRTPFAGKTNTDVLAAIIGSEPLPISRFAGDAPREVHWITQKALHKERDERYQSAKEMLADLRRVKRDVESGVPAAGDPAAASTIASDDRVSGSPTDPATTVSSAEYVMSGIRKHRTAFAIVIVAVVSAILIAGLFSLRSTPIDSVAVLPFEYAEGDPDSEYLADGLTESLINSLSEIDGLRVVPRSLVFAYKGSPQSIEEIASDLGARAVVTGRILKNGERVDVQVDLVDVESSAQLWGDRFAGNESDVMEVHRRITQAISGRIRPAMDESERSRVEKAYAGDPEAYDLYLRGLYLWNQRTPDDIMRSIDLYREALDRDPTFAEAWAALSNAYTILPTYRLMSPNEAFPKSKEAARRALELDPDLAPPYAALAAALFEHDYNPAEAERHYRRAIELDPDYPAARYWYSEFLVAMGRPREALDQALAARKADPLSIAAAQTVVGAYIALGDFEKAWDAIRVSEQIDPDFPNLYLMRGIVLFNQGREEEAADQMEEFAAATGDLPAAVWAHQLRGERAEALRLARELEQRALAGDSPAYGVAMSFAALGMYEDAMNWLERAYANRETWHLMFIGRDTLFAPMYDDPRFQELIRKLRLPPPTIWSTE
ncbi:MAG: protein kinase [Acidobacteria bacterium]|nr:protein kinase [Acidobacteriota bacterium]